MILSYAYVEHSGIFEAIGKVNDGIFKLRCELDRHACWESNGFTDFYFRNFREDTPQLNDSPLSGSTAEQFGKFLEKVNSLRISKTRPDGISYKDHTVIAETLRIANEKVQTAGLALFECYFPDERPSELAKTVCRTIYDLRKALVFKLLAETPADKEKKTKSLHLYFLKGAKITRRAAA